MYYIIKLRNLFYKDGEDHEDTDKRNRKSFIQNKQRTSFQNK